MAWLRLLALLAIASAVPVGLLVAAGAPDGRGEHADPVVTAVVDGDTIEVGVGDRHAVVRLLGIDTPESVDPNRPVQCFGAEATSALGALLPTGTPVHLERDVEAVDAYGRILAYVFRRSDGMFVNEALLVDGFADLSMFEPNHAYAARLRSAYTRARTAEVGLWRACGGADVPLDPPPVTVG